VLLELRSVIHPVRHIQTVAQRTKELVVFQVYLLMMHLYFGLLDAKKPLDIYDPSLTIILTETSNAMNDANPLDRLQPTSQVPTIELDPRTHSVREKLHAALFQRFFKRYHPIKAYRKESYNRRLQPDKKDLLFSYLLDIQQVFHPALSNMKLLQKIVFSFPDVTQIEKERHYKVISNYIWKIITCLVEQVAYDRLTKNPQIVEQEEEGSASTSRIASKETTV
jgi:hypothetical protein